MATYREHKGRVTATIRKQGHRSLSKTFNTKKQASKWARQTETDIERGQAVANNRITLADSIDSYEQDANLNKYQKTVLKWWRKELGGRVLISLTKSDFRAARKRLQETESRQGGELEPATINRRLSLISAVITRAMEDEDWLTSNPARIRRLTEDNERERLLNDDEVKRLLTAAKAHPEPCMHAMITAAMVSGARAGELRHLQWKDIDLEKGTARLLRTKNGDTRVIPIRGFALDTLNAIPRRLDHDYIFWNATGFAPIYYRKAWSEIRDAAGMPDVRFHDLRHLAASHMAMAGVSLREIAEVLGHRSLQMVMRYSHFLDDHIASVGDKVAERLFK